jgi:hypothetical protein
MAAPAEIIDLISRFEQHLDAYRAGQYNETQLRRDFLDPFFKALGAPNTQKTPRLDVPTFYPSKRPWGFAKAVGACRQNLFTQE